MYRQGLGLTQTGQESVGDVREEKMVYGLRQYYKVNTMPDWSWGGGDRSWGKWGTVTAPPDPMGFLYLLDLTKGWVLEECRVTST